MSGAEELLIEVHGKSTHAGVTRSRHRCARFGRSGGGSRPGRRTWEPFSRRGRNSLLRANHGGTANNVLADLVTIEGTMRFFSEEVRERLHRRLDEAFGVLEESGAKVTIRIGTGYLPVINDDRVTELVRAAAIDLLGEDNVLPIQPMTLAEDFSFLANEAPGTFFWVGQHSRDRACTMRPTSISTNRPFRSGPPRWRPAPSAFCKRWGNPCNES